MESLDFIKKLLSELDESWSIRDVKNEIELFLTDDVELNEDSIFSNPFKLGLLDTSSDRTPQYNNPFDSNSENVEWKEYNRGFKQGRK